jgi:multisubunit Na+/H+ antiporter MnhG subunit
VQWPPQFLTLLASLSFISFDMSAISGMFCLVRVDFYTDLVCSTMGVVTAVAVIWLACATKQCSKEAAMQLATYLLIFAYPMLSVKIVGMFGCHTVDGVAYLRADYSLQCYDGRWNIMAAYASIYLVVYVAGMPLLMLKTVFGYRHLLAGRKDAPDGLFLGFLLNDYKLTMPCLLWDGKATRLIYYITNRF